MPNGGSDNCGMCLWNDTKKDRTDGGYCNLRAVSVNVPFWTYCDNFCDGQLPAEKPIATGTIYSSGIFEGFYTRIPWFGHNEPKPYTSGKCSVTGEKFREGITLVDKVAGVTYKFATNDIYHSWVEAHSNLDNAALKLLKKESTGDKDLHAVYTELFHTGRLCSDFMHCGVDKVFKPYPEADSDMSFAELLENKILGTILCGAIGDAMGRQVESKSPGSYQPVTWYTPWSGWKNGPIGTITDDTQMTWWLTESLLANGKLVPEDLAIRFTREHIRGIGAATKKFVAKFKDQKLAWYESSEHSSGNGAAMRAAPVGIFFRNDFDELKLAAGMQAMVTHNDPMAIASSIIVAYATARLLRMDVKQLSDLDQKTVFCHDLADVIAGIENNTKYVTRNNKQISTLESRIRVDIPQFLGAKTSPADVQNTFWSGAYVLESLPFALYCFLYSPGDFGRVLYNSINESRDSDTVAAMACSFCGSLNGLSGCMNIVDLSEAEPDSDFELPPQINMRPGSDYLAELECRDDLTQLAKRLTAEAWNG